MVDGDHSKESEGKSNALSIRPKFWVEGKKELVAVHLVHRCHFSSSSWSTRMRVFALGGRTDHGTLVASRHLTG